MGARLGWAVPSYIPEDQLGSIPDLRGKAVGGQLSNTIIGIDAGAGIVRLSREALQKYNLQDKTTGASRVTVRNVEIRDADYDYSDEYELSISSAKDMTNALIKARANEDWIVVTGWTPHWMFAAYDMRFLDDPKGVFGKDQRVVALARPEFSQDEPKAAAFIARMHIPLDDLNKALLDAQRSSEDQAVVNFIKNHAKRIDYWVTGKL